MKWLLLYLVCCTSLHCGPEWLKEFEASLQRNLNIEVLRPYEHGNRFYLAHPSLAKRWGLISNSAAATYNGWLNTIEIHQDNTIKEDGETRVKSIEELQQQSEYGWSIAVATVFHEVAHAEFDLYVEEDNTPEDAKLYKLIQDEIRPWFKRNYPKINSSIAISELFAYFRTSIIETFHNDIDNILIANGINRFKMHCILSKQAKESIHKQSLDEFVPLKLHPSDQEADVPYSLRIDPGYVYVKGQDASLHKAKEEFPKAWLEALWRQFRSFHNVPFSKREMLDFVNQRHPLSDFARTCRSDLYKQATNQGESNSSFETIHFKQVEEAR